MLIASARKILALYIFAPILHRVRKLNIKPNNFFLVNLSSSVTNVFLSAMRLRGLLESKRRSCRSQYILTNCFLIIGQLLLLKTFRENARNGQRCPIEFKASELDRLYFSQDDLIGVRFGKQRICSIRYRQAFTLPPSVF